MPATERAIRVLLVDDSALVLAMLTRILEADPGIEVVGTARDGAEGLVKVAELDPDVVCTDLQMPVMGGLEFTQRVMASRPRPILVVSIAVQADQHDNIFRLIEAGAVDVFPKPSGGFQVDSAQAEALRRRVRVVAGVRVFRRRQPSAPVSVPVPTRPGDVAYEVVGIGASTGGPRALATVLGALPRDFAVPILVVQHISRGFAGSLVSWLDDVVPLPVRFAQSGQHAEPGVVYLPPEGCDLVVDGQGRLSTLAGRDETTVPSADVLFASLATGYGARAVGVLLTGMGSDGAAGLHQMASAGALTIAQDEETSVVFGMPGAAVRLGAAREVLPIGAIGPYLAGLATRHSLQKAKGSTR